MTDSAQSRWQKRALMALPTAVTLLSLLIVIAVNVWWDKQDALGELPVPGEAQFQLPQGMLDIGFDAVVRGENRKDNDQPIPRLSLWLTAPEGVPQSDVVVTATTADEVSKAGGPVTVWTANIPAAGMYHVKVDADVRAYTDPRLTFGEAPHWAVEVLDTIFGILLTIGLIGHAVFLLRYWLRRRSKRRAAG